MRQRGALYIEDQHLGISKHHKPVCDYGLEREGKLSIIQSPTSDSNKGSGVKAESMQGWTPNVTEGNDVDQKTLPIDGLKSFFYR